MSPRRRPHTRGGLPQGPKSGPDREANALELWNHLRVGRALRLSSRTTEELEDFEFVPCRDRFLWHPIVCASPLELHTKHCLRCPLVRPFAHLCAQCAHLFSHLYHLHSGHVRSGHGRAPAAGSGGRAAVAAPTAAPMRRGAAIVYHGANADELPWSRIEADTEKLTGEDAAFLQLEVVPGAAPQS